MSEDIRETIKKTLLDKIKDSSTEQERYDALLNLYTFMQTLHIEASISEFTE